jgi:hypothetical protein
MRFANRRFGRASSSAAQHTMGAGAQGRSRVDTSQQGSGRTLAPPELLNVLRDLLVPLLVRTCVLALQIERSDSDACIAEFECTIGAE